MSVRRSRLAASSMLGLAIVPLVASCTAAPPPSFDDVGAAREEIANGRLATEPEVGLLFVPGHGYCSATLVGRRTALTAAHCAVPQSQTLCFYPAGDSNVSAGQGARCVAVQVVPNPNYIDTTDDETSDNDIAVVLLSEDVAAVDPRFKQWFPNGITPATIGGSVQQDEIITVVGWGKNLEDSGADRLQRFGENRITDIDDQRFSYDNSGGAYALEGDSGGPAFHVDCVIGVESTGSVTGDDRSTLTRVGTHAGWIRSVTNDLTVHDCGAPACGDGLCQWPETCSSCPSDCTVGCPPPPRCGDGVCNGSESHASCPQDCPAGTCTKGKFDCCDDGVCRTQIACQHLGCL